jgi:phage terminase large subunit
MIAAGRTLNIPTPRAFLPMLGNHEFQGAKGGRGGGKSHLVAGLLVEEMLSMHTRVACVREVQNSIKDSVKQLVEDYIGLYGVRSKFKITDREIVCPSTDSLMIFRGLQNHTATSIKSLEGFNRPWYEEAQSLTKRSLELAIPTFRKPGTIQRFTWNPDLDTDPVDTLFRENANDPDFLCVEVNYWDNPWFPDVLRKQMERDKARDPEKYHHVWCGGYRRNSDAQVFRNWKVERFDAPPPGTPLYFGADWGFTIDPSVLVCCFIIGRTLYVWREVWELGCSIDRRAALFDKIDPDWSIANAKDPNWRSIARRYQITADSAEPQTIDFMQRNGFPRMQPAVKGPNSVEEGVSFLQGYDIVVHPDCKFGGISHIEKELRLYSYKTDKKTGAVLPELDDKDNHVIDALRYALEAVRRAITTTRRELRI